MVDPFKGDITGIRKAYLVLGSIQVVPRQEYTNFISLRKKNRDADWYSPAGSLDYVWSVLVTSRRLTPGTGRSITTGFLRFPCRR